MPITSSILLRWLSTRAALPSAPTFYGGASPQPVTMGGTTQLDIMPGTGSGTASNGGQVLVGLGQSLSRRLLIRAMTSGDIPVLRDIHAGAGYTFACPDFFSPLVLNKVVSTEGGIIVASGWHKVCYETVALVNPDATPQEKWAALREIDSELSTRAFRQGLDTVHAAVLPTGFDKRLLQLGWKSFPNGSKLWSRQTSEISHKSSH